MEEAPSVAPSFPDITYLQVSAAAAHMPSYGKLNGLLHKPPKARPDVRDTECEKGKKPEEMTNL